MTSDNAAAGIGHNKPPKPDVASEATLLGYIKSEYEPIVADYESLVKQEADLPVEVKTDEDSARYTDFIVALTKADKAFEAARVNEGAPYLTGQRVVNNYFKKFTESIEKIKKRVDAPNQKYLKWKSDEEKRIAKEKADKEKEDARIALEKAKEIEAAANKAIADAEKEKQRIKDEADAKVKAAEAEVEKAKQAAAGDAKTIKTLEKTLEETKKEIATKTDEAVRPVIMARRAARVSKERALDEAVSQDQVAAKAEREVEGVSMSERSRTRGETGVGAVAKEWVFRIDRRTGREGLDLEPLRAHLSWDELERAGQAAVRAGARKIKGALITEEIKTTYR